MSRPIIEVSTDLAGGIVLSTTDKWLVEDVAESVAKIVSPKTFVHLSVALDGYNQADASSVADLDLARYQVATETAYKSVVLARMLPFEIVSLIQALEAAIEKTA